MTRCVCRRFQDGWMDSCEQRGVGEWVSERVSERGVNVE
jgi:hypothetical protein